MPAVAIWAVLAAAVVVAIGGTPRARLAVLAVTWLLVPGGARLPGAEGGHLFLHRIVIAAVLIGVAGAVLSRRIDARVFGVRGVHVAFGAYLLVAALTGLAMAEPGTPARLNTNAFLELAEQAAFFVTALAVIRSVGARGSAAIVTATAGVAGAIGIVEHLLGWSYSRWFVRDLADPTGLLSLPLTTRGPHDRIRVAATFALEFGWVVALLIPLAVAVAIVSRNRAAWAAPAVLSVSMVWTWSRSAYAGLAVGALVLGLGIVLDRPRRALPLGFAGLALSAVVLQGPLREALDVGVTGGESDVRFERLPEILALVAERPVTGLGLGGLRHHRIDVVDISWVTSYATIGVLGVIALAALLVSAAHACSRFVLSAPSATRTIAAGAAGAVVAAPIGLASYDLGTLRMSTEAIWVLAALALVANEELGVLPVPAARRTYAVPALVAGLGALGLLGGLALAATVPGSHSIDATFTTVAPRVAATAPTDQPYTIKVLSQTGCVVVEAIETGATVRCQDLDQVAGGVGRLRVEAADETTVDRAYGAVTDALRDTFPRGTVAVSARGSGRPTWATTAPLWLQAAGIALGATAPDRAVRRLRSRRVRSTGDPDGPGGGDPAANRTAPLPSTGGG